MRLQRQRLDVQQGFREHVLVSVSVTSRPLLFVSQSVCRYLLYRHALLSVCLSARRPSAKGWGQKLKVQLP